jgi:hypothetical protein
MNANELRLGNWVHPVFPMKVVSIYADEILCNFEGNEGDVWEFNPKDLDGIPMTDEWLERFGFKLISNYQPEGKIYAKALLDFTTKIKIEVCIAYNFIEIEGNLGSIRVPAKHVHQLQNLYHALTGKEL